MANYPNKIQVATAITDRSNINLSCQHITTGNFMDFMVSKRVRMVPNQSVDIKHRLFTRMDPLEVPTYGDSDIRTRAFFVPYRTVMPAWNDFIEDAVHCYSDFNGDSVYSLVPYAHRFKNSELVKAFTYTNTGSYEPMSTLTTEIDNADIVIIESNGTPRGYNLTPHGSRCLKILLSLGYAVDWNLKNDDIYHCALPLLCLVKVYYDWYYQNQYITDAFAMELERMLNYNLSTDFSEYLTSLQFVNLFGLIEKVNYDSDYFVSAWDNPVGPTLGSMSNMAIPDITNNYDGNKVTNNYGITQQGTPVLQSTVYNEGTRTFMSKFGLDALQSFSDYAKRKQIAGARVYDRYLAEFGVTLQSEALKRSVYLTDYIQPVDVGDVTSTASTEGANLGSYAGKGISDGAGSLSFSTVEHGELIIISTIIPRTGYFQGQDKTTMSQTRTDFWLPEFDSLGVQSLDTREVYMPLDARKQYPAGTTTYSKLNYNNYVFGFVPRYAEYKRAVDMVTGDYRLKSRELTGLAWTNMRDLEPTFSKLGIEGTKHDRIFTTGADSEQYNRVFYTTNEEYDHFKIQHNFWITSSFPGKKLFDDYEFKDEDKAQKVSVDLQGVKAN